MAFRFFRHSKIFQGPLSSSVWDRGKKSIGGEASLFGEGMHSVVLNLFFYSKIELAGHIVAREHSSLG